MKRTMSRLRALLNLYNYDLTQDEVEETYLDNLFNESDEKLEYDIDFYNELVNGVKNHLKDIDKIIAVSLKKYSLDQLSYVDRNLIRIATYELKYTKTSKNIIINEILDLSHEYSETDKFSSVKFNNALLENIALKVENGK